ncbi:MAG: TolC family protein [Gammaproteobacteria bacterium]|nr:TolC family protein [Gammaproteobacteria bacterium]
MQKIVSTLLVAIVLAISFNIKAEVEQRWTLTDSIKRAMEVAPELKMAAAQIVKQQAELEQAGAWPNPSVDIQVDDKLGINDNAGGYDVTQLSVSQPLPMSRLEKQHSQAIAKLASSKALLSQQQLILEYQVAQHFHILQLATEKFEQANMRLNQANSYQTKGRKQTSADPLIRYLTPLERMRLNIVQQEAKQMLDIAEGEFNEAAYTFKALLNIPADTKLKLAELTSVPSLGEFSHIENTLENHPLLKAGSENLAAAQAGVAVAKSQRFDDPVLTLFRGRDSISNRRENITGVMLSVQVPLWDRKNGAIIQARQTVIHAQSELSIQQRDLHTRMQKSYLHLGHLIEQAKHYRTTLLATAHQVFRLTRKGFNAGELNILTLIDANNTYFNAKVRHLELLQEGWLELADLRQSAGISALATNQPLLSTDEEKQP